MSGPGGIMRGSAPATGLLSRAAASVWSASVWRQPAGTITMAWGRLAQSPASARRAAALSVFSQVNSGSSRPKWP